MTTTNYFATGLNDPGIINQWQHFRMNVLHAWKHTTGASGVVIGIIGSKAEGFGGSVSTTPSAAWNVANNSTDVTPSDPDALNSHDEFCYALMAETVGSYGGRGVCPGCSFLQIQVNPFQYGDGCQVYNEQFIAAMNYCVNPTQTPALKARLISCSSNGPSSQGANFNQSGVIEQASSQVITDITAAAANVWNNNAIMFYSGSDPYPSVPWQQMDPAVNQGAYREYPATLPNIQLVGSLTSADNTNYTIGPEVCFSAPGNQVYTGYQYGSSPSNYGNGDSFATPLTTGVGGLVLSINPDLTNAQCLAILRSTMDAPVVSTQAALVPNAGIPNAGKAVCKARSTLSANVGVPIPYISFTNQTNTNSIAISAGVATQPLNGSYVVDIDGFCDPDNPVTHIQVIVNGTTVYDGLPCRLAGTATSGSNNVTVRAYIAKRDGSSDPIYTEETYTDILVGTLTLSRSASATFRNRIPLLPSLSQLGNQWHLARIDALQAWRYSTGDPAVKLMIPDSGIVPHPELTGIETSALCYDWGTSTSGASADNSYASNTFTTGGSTYYSHGSALQSVVKTAQINIRGIAPGISCGAQVVAYQDGDGIWQQYSFANFSSAINQAISFGVKVLSISWAFDEATWPSFQSLFTSAWNAGCLVVLAAGNNNINLGTSGKGLTNCIIVGGVDASDNQADYTSLGYDGAVKSNYGTPINITGPSINILTANAVNTVPTNLNPPFNGYYEDFGTSLATPQVAAVAAHIWSINPALTIGQVVSILTTCTSAPLSSSYATYFPSAGILNAGKCVAKALSTLAINSGMPIPYLHVLGAAVQYSFASGVMTTQVNSGQVVLDLGAYCDQAITSVELWVGNTQIYSGPPARLTGNATPPAATYSPNTMKVVAHTASAAVAETYADIQVGTLTFAQAFTINNCTSATTADNVTLALPNTLNVQSCTSATRADNLTLSLSSISIKDIYGGAGGLVKNIDGSFGGTIKSFINGVWQ